MIVKTVTDCEFFLGDELSTVLDDVPIYFCGYQRPDRPKEGRDESCYVYIKAFQFLQVLAKKPNIKFEIISEDV
jgi:hypothetical protein